MSIRIILPDAVPPYGDYAVAAPRAADPVVGALTVAFACMEDLPGEFAALLAQLDKLPRTRRRK